MSGEKTLRKLEEIKAIWQEKQLDYQHEQSITDSSEKKFKLKKGIEECKEKIEEIEAQIESFKTGENIDVYNDLSKIQEEIADNQGCDFIVPNMNILHLSDLHFGTLDDAQLWSSQLIEDLQINLRIEKVDALVLSGDITSRSTPEEYKAAQEFINKFCNSFSLESDRIIIVPGNHDINWDFSKDAYILKDKCECTSDELKEGYYIPVGEDAARVIDKEKHLLRFSNFQNFYDVCKGKAKLWNLDVKKQYSLDIIGDRILILGLNSAWELDHHFRKPTINDLALTNALDEIRDNDRYKGCPTKIVVWHHPINSPFEDRIKNSDFLQRLAVNGFHFFLHGHIHRADNSLFSYDAKQLHGICAGTFGASRKELNPGVPWQYNLLKFEKNQLIVETRCRVNENGAWQPHAIWGQGAGKDPLPRYHIPPLPVDVK
jgi:hypothetical protein